MNKHIEKILGVLVALPILGILLLASSEGQDVKLRFLEGIKEGVTEAPAVATSSYLKPTIRADFDSAPDLAEVIQQVKKVFNLKDVQLVIEAGLDWPSSGERQISHILRLGSAQYNLRMSATGPESKAIYRLQIEEQTDDKKSGLLDSEFLLPDRKMAVFGFEDAAGKPYFVSLYVAPKAAAAQGGVEGGVQGGVEGGLEGGVAGGVAGGVKGGVEGIKKSAMRKITVIEPPSQRSLEEFEKSAVRAEGEVKPPKLLKKVDPVFPEESRREHFGSLVIMSAKTDNAGRVIDCVVLKMVLDVPEEKADDKALINKHRDLFRKAAVDAVKSWLYEPMMIKGKPFGVIFTVTVRFTLKS